MSDTFTVVVAPAGSPVRDNVAQWTSAELLTPSCWLTPDDVDDGDPVRPRASWIMPGEVVERDLLTLLGSSSRRLIRLIVLQVLPRGAQGDDALAEVGQRVARVVKSALPTAAVADGPRTELLRINMMVPESGAKDVDGALMQGGWEINVVISPEDRPGLDRASVLVRSGENLSGHAASAVATTGGLWRGAAAGAFDDHVFDSATGGSDLFMVRSLVWIVRGPDRLAQLTQEAMTAVLEEPLGAVAFLDRAQPARHPAELVDRSVQYLASDAGFRQRADPPGQQSRTGNWLLPRGASGDIAAFQLGLVKTLGLWRHRPREGPLDATSAVTPTDTVDHIVHALPRDATEAAALAERRLEQSARDQIPSLEREAKIVIPADSRMWSRLRQVCFGLVDGGALPDDYETSYLADKRELLAPMVIAPPPNDTFADVIDDDEVTVRSCDPAAARSLRDQVSLIGGADEPGGHRQPANDKTPVELWTDRRRASLLWRLAEIVDRERMAAYASASSFWQEVTATTPAATTRLESAQLQLRASWVVTVLAAAAAVVWSIVRQNDTIPTLIAAIAAVLALAVLLLGAAGHRYYRALRQYEKDVQALMARQSLAGQRWVRARQDATRLDVVYDQLVDWGEIIGWVLHRPWEPTSCVGLTELPHPELDSLPAAVTVAVAVDEASSTRAALVERWVRELCPVGWVRRTYDDVIGLAENVGIVSGGSHELAQRVDSDTSAGPTGARKSLLGWMEQGTFASELARASLRRTRSLAQNGQLPVPDRVVTRRGRFASSDRQQEGEFFRDAFGPQTPFVGDGWSDQGLLKERHLLRTSVAWVPKRPGEDEQSDNKLIRRASDGDCAIRVDLSSNCDPGDLSLFKFTTPTPPPSQAEPGGDFI